MSTTDKHNPLAVPSKLLYSTAVETLHWRGSVSMHTLTNGNYRVSGGGLADGFLITPEFEEACEYYIAAVAKLNAVNLQCVRDGQ